MNANNPTRLLICGATGFIGRNLVEAFAEDQQYDVTGVYLDSEPWSHPGLRMVRADLRRPEDVDRLLGEADVVIQAAATTSGAKDIVQRPYVHVTDNAIMNSLILRSSFERNIRHLVFFSCTVMYQSNDQPLRESDFDPSIELNRNYFGVGWTKLYVEKMCEFYSRLGRTKYTVLRHSNIYGPHDKYDLERSHVFGATLTKVMTAKDDKITVWGSGEEERDLLYVSDLVEGVRLALERQEAEYELFNMGYGSSIAIQDLVQRIIDASGRKLKIEHDLTKPTIKTTLCLDNSKIEHGIGWKPRTSLDEGIAKTMAWYRKNILTS